MDCTVQQQRQQQTHRCGSCTNRRGRRQLLAQQSVPLHSLRGRVVQSVSRQSSPRPDSEVHHGEDADCGAQTVTTTAALVEPLHAAAPISLGLRLHDLCHKQHKHPAASSCVPAAWSRSTRKNSRQLSPLRQQRQLGDAAADHAALGDSYL